MRTGKGVHRERVDALLPEPRIDLCIVRSFAVLRRPPVVDGAVGDGVTTCDLLSTAAFDAVTGYHNSDIFGYREAIKYWKENKEEIEKKLKKPEDNTEACY